MTTTTSKPRRRPRKDSPEPTEAALARVSTALAVQKRRLSTRHRRFVTLVAGSGIEHADRIASSLGFTRPGVGYRLTIMLGDLIDAEKIRLKLAEEMSLHEALLIISEIARDAASPDTKTRLAAATTIARGHGFGSDRPLTPQDRQEYNRELDGLLGFVKAQMSERKTKIRLRTIEKSLEIAPEGE